MAGIQEASPTSGDRGEVATSAISAEEIRPIPPSSSSKRATPSSSQISSSSQSASSSSTQISHRSQIARALGMGPPLCSQ
eukprot:3792000-Pyramimonas_sp.AAC.1